MPERIAVVEDEETLRKNLVRYLEQEGHTVLGFEGAEAMLSVLDQEAFDVAVVDLRLPGRDGLSLAADLSLRSPDTMILMMTAYGSVESVIEALHAGVHDYMIKPVLLKDVAHKVAVLCEHRQLLRENARLRQKVVDVGDGPVVRSHAMSEVYTLVRQVAPSNTTVLIEGESGSGKEVIARALHEHSPRNRGPFVAVNMAAIPPNLVESHLFGHERGAYTGAEASREGVFRAAARGTLFLDEIGDMPLGDQSKLLRALECREITPVGSDRPVKIDCRILAATNSDLLELVQQKRFRSDLYYRLSAIRITVPPLRARIEDIPALAQHFLMKHAREHGRAMSGFDGFAMRKLLAYPWPGNVRELSNVIERATVVCPGSTIGLSELPREVAGADAPQAATGARSAAAADSYQEAMAGFERILIGETLERTAGDRREAARQLGLSLATLYRRIEKLGLKGTKVDDTDMPRESQPPSSSHAEGGR